MQVGEAPNFPSFFFAKNCFIQGAFMVVLTNSI